MEGQEQLSDGPFLLCAVLWLWSTSGSAYGVITGLILPKTLVLRELVWPGLKVKTQENQHGLRKASSPWYELGLATSIHRGTDLEDQQPPGLWRAANRLHLTYRRAEEGYGHAVTRKAMPLTASSSKSCTPTATVSPSCHVPSHSAALRGSSVAF